MRFLNPDRDAHLELALQDVFIVPGCWEGGSRMETDLTPSDFAGGSHPVVAANMNAVTGKRMAEAMARFGGLGVLPQDMALEHVERIVKHIQAADPRYDTPLWVRPSATLRDVDGIIRKRAHKMVVVVDEQRRPVGIVKPGDLRERDQYAPVTDVMTPNPITLPVGTSNRDAYLHMAETRVESVPVVDADGRLAGVMTRADAVRLDLLTPALDAQGRLMVAAAVGISADAVDRAGVLAELGVGAIVLDTAHGHQRRMLDTVAAVRERVGPGVPLVAGNVCTAGGTRQLIEAGADIVKVNVGPGAMCTTRMQTGVGRPTFSAVAECAAEARRLGKHVWADGGVRHPRDVAIYCAAGAARVMVGTMMAGTWESPGDIQVDPEGHLYKVNWGMASARAVSDRTSHLDAFDRAKKGFFREGISKSRIYLREGQESVGAILVDIITGLQSSLTYVGARSLEAFHAEAVIGVQTVAGFGEGMPHGRVRK